MNPSLPSESQPAPAVPPAEGQTPLADPKPAPAVAHWPTWHPMTDTVAVVLVILAGFLAASFAARNSDVWLHLATGRLIASGEYPWGGDPFSYVAPERPWVNTSWLYGVGLYLAYSIAPMSGAVPVALKALAFAGAFGLGLLLRRPGQSLWPWAVCIGLGVLAAAPSAFLRPIVGSMLFVGLTLFILFRGRWAVGSWREVGLLGVLFAVWANTDSWFILGPFTLLLILIGELFDRFALGNKEPRPDSPIFPSAPPVSMLVRALVVGSAVCLLNPTLLAGLTKDPTEALAQLIPAEAGWSLPPEAANDRELVAATISPINPDYLKSPQLGYNVNGLAFALLLVGGAAILGLDSANVRAAHVLLWLGYAGVAVLQFRLIPLFVVVAVPLSAAHWNGLAGRVRLGSVNDPRTRVVLTLSGVGRILTVAATALMAVSAWPGWLHPTGFDPASARRVEWAIDPDPGAKRIALVLNQWHSEGELPTEVRGLAFGPEIGDYCHWFAPGERVFVDSRFTYHRHEFPELFLIRFQLGYARTTTQERPDFTVVGDVARKYGCGYVVVPGVGRFADYRREFQRAMFLMGVANLVYGPEQWQLWHLDGRAAVLGRPDESASERLRFDPIRQAFGPQVRQVPPAAAARAGLPEGEWSDAMTLWDQFTERPIPFPIEADDAAVFEEFGRIHAEQTSAAWQESLANRLSAYAAVSGVAATVAAPAAQPPLNEDLIGYALLALRSARTAAAVSPDRAEVLRLLANAYESPRLPMFQPLTLPVLGPRFAGPDQPVYAIPYQVPGDRPEQVITAIRRALDRLPKPSACRPEQALSGLLWNMQLQNLYSPMPPRNLPPEEAEAFARNQQLDLALEAVEAASNYARAIAPYPDLLMSVLPAGAQVENPAEAVMKNLKDREDQLTEQAVSRNDILDRQAGASPIDRFFMADRLGLPGKAIELFKRSDLQDFGAGDHRLAAAIRMIELEFRAGRLEDAARDVEVFSREVADGGPTAQTNPLVRDAAKYLNFRVAHLTGNYELAGREWVGLFEGRIGSFQVEERSRAVSTQTGAESVGLAAVGGVTALLYAAERAQETAQIRSQLLNEAYFYFNRAVLALQGGNVKEATDRFEQALNPQGVKLAELGDVNRAKEIELLLRMIRESAEKPRK